MLEIGQRVYQYKTRGKNAFEPDGPYLVAAIDGPVITLQGKNGYTWTANVNTIAVSKQEVAALKPQPRLPISDEEHDDDDF